MKGSEIANPGHLIGLKPRRFPNWGARQQPIKICPQCYPLHSVPHRQGRQENLEAPASKTADSFWNLKFQVLAPYMQNFFAQILFLILRILDLTWNYETFCSSLQICCKEDWRSMVVLGIYSFKNYALDG